ncbi:MAG: diphthamide biosynthesis enzyme Dph2 [Candidatus Aenigmarchaeota archaeon]|nr:diphthamide biosynthesis enzyme Dph2 [Candidatus Aenigmarchaeota archaeon]
MEKVMIQAPEGYKKKLMEFADSQNGKEVFISVEPCYGACDLRDRDAKQLGCDKLVHYGHNDFGVRPSIPVEYVILPATIDPTPVLKDNLSALENYKRIGIVSTVNFLSLIPKVKEFLSENGKQGVVGEPAGGKWGASAAGQILGCDVTAAQVIESKVDCFLYIGTGKFHPTGMKTKKPFFILDLEKNSLERHDIDHERLERQRYARIAIAKTSDKFGLLLSTKEGQFYLNMARRARDILQKNGKKAYILIADEFTPEKLMGIDVDCYVNCSCPRMSDDSQRFGKPVITAADIEALDSEKLS